MMGRAPSCCSLWSISQRQRHRPSKTRIIKGRYAAIDDQSGRKVRWPQFPDRLRHLAPDVLEKRDGQLVGEGHIELAGDKRENRRRPIRYDRVIDPVEVRTTFLPIVWVPGQLDRLVRLELDELERASADRVLPHFARWDVTGIDRRVSRGEEH